MDWPADSAQECQNLEKEALAGVAQCTEGWPANRRIGSGHMPASPVGVHKRQPHTDVSFPLHLPPFL